MVHLSLPAAPHDHDAFTKLLDQHFSKHNGSDDDDDAGLYAGPLRSQCQPGDAELSGIAGEAGPHKPQTSYFPSLKLHITLKTLQQV